MTTTPPAPSLVAFTDADPCPRIEITVTPMPVDAATMTVWRTYAGTTEVVRGGQDVVVAGAALLVDYEAPLGVDVTYTCQTADSSGTPSALSPASAIAHLAVTQAWAQDPLDPSQSMPWPLGRGASLTTPPLTVKVGSLTGQSYAAAASAVAVMGSPLPIGQSDVRQGAAAVPISLDARTADQWNAVKALLDQALVMCLRVPDGAMPLLPPLVYLQMPSYTQAADPSRARVLFTAQGTQVRGPSLGVIVAVRDYNDLASEAATYSGLQALYATYLDATRGH